MPASRSIVAGFLETADRSLFKKETKESFIGKTSKSKSCFINNSLSFTSIVKRILSSMSAGNSLFRFGDTGYTLYSSSR